MQPLKGNSLIRKDSLNSQVSKSQFRKVTGLKRVLLTFPFHRIRLKTVNLRQNQEDGQDWQHRITRFPFTFSAYGRRERSAIS